ncbi:hypothetical protein HZH68_016210 [Vespula germanica]|uniref:Uncharacterized protein n=1 Tax=Vespula germanica TaxID=30212 RepID=A0A834MPU1_VESGE|nr:hypothetical protein HZH68_016210 [Vespula germanica]
MKLFYEVWNGGTRKCEGFSFLKGTNRERLQLEGIGDYARKDLAMDHFLRKQLIWNILYEILDDWRCKGIIVLHSSIGSKFLGKYNSIRLLAATIQSVITADRLLQKPENVKARLDTYTDQFAHDIILGSYQ